MSALLALLIIGGAVWFVVVKAGVRPGSMREPMDSVSEFARAMTALDPTAAPARRQAALTHAPVRRQAALTRAPVPRQAALRRPAPRVRPARRPIPAVRPLPPRPYGS